ncbi:MAG TPA: hypothetical protein V6C72_17205, partial [Chroococcales cyanobacterium]
MLKIAENAARRNMDKLNQAEAQAKEAPQDRESDRGSDRDSDWIAEVSHELRLPIANIRLLVETLL